MTITRRLALCLCLPFFIAACSEDDKPNKPKPKSEIEQSVGSPESNVILVTDDVGTPLGGVRLLIGWAPGVPFDGNDLTTDANGQLPIPAGWTNAQAVTAHKFGYVRVTYLEHAPSGMTFRLRKINKTPSLEVTGSTTGHPVRNYDDIADVGLVMSTLTRNDIMAFELSRVISNQLDPITVMGQTLNVPSNVTLPAQKENYSVFPISVSKPTYKLSFGDPGPQKIFAAQARFPFSAAVDQLMAKKKFYDLINLITISGGVVRDVNVRAGGTKVDLPVSEMKFTGRKTFRAPALGADEVMIGLAAANLQGSMFPTDVKRFESNQSISMSLYPDAPASAVGVLKRASEFEGAGVDRLSAVILPFNSDVSPQFLPMIADPQAVGDNGVAISRPSGLTGVNELATLALLSEVKQIPMGSSSMTFLIRKWEIYAPTWVDRITLPQFPVAMPRGDKMRWETAFIGSQLKDQAEMGQAVIDAATHFTHSSVDF